MHLIDFPKLVSAIFDSYYADVCWMYLCFSELLGEQGLTCCSATFSHCTEAVDVAGNDTRMQRCSRNQPDGDLHWVLDVSASVPAGKPQEPCSSQSVLQTQRRPGFIIFCHLSLHPSTRYRCGGSIIRPVGRLCSAGATDETQTLLHKVR